METIYLSLSSISAPERRISLCLGYFDGVHIGHQRLIKTALESGYDAALLSFDFSINVSFKNKQYLTSIADKERILAQAGLSYFYLLRFDDQIKNLSPQEFIDKIIVPLNVAEVVVGEDYSFGKNAQGDVALLKRLSQGLFNVKVVPELKVDDKKIGTRDIIKLILDGEVVKAKQLLGRSYQISGKVKEGFHFGRGKNVPTANIDPANYVVPKKGVYACFVKIDETIYQGMANVGVHPTINQLSETVVEINIFDFDRNIYGSQITIYFEDFIRDEYKFNSVDELYHQLDKDRITCQRILSSLNQAEDYNINL